MTSLSISAVLGADDLRITPQARIILRHLKAGKGISPQEALVVYSISRLASCIHEIRAAGYRVCTTMRQDERDHKYAKYTLAPVVN